MIESIIGGVSVALVSGLFTFFLNRSGRTRGERMEGDLKEIKDGLKEQGTQQLVILQTLARHDVRLDDHARRLSLLERGP